MSLLGKNNHTPFARGSKLANFSINMICYVVLFGWSFFLTEKIFYSGVNKNIFKPE